MMRRFDLQGHRGARGLFPENTLEGFLAAWDLGVRAFELDAGMTADGVVVVTHDLVLNPDIVRGPDGQWLPAPGPPIWSLRYANLQMFDVGRLRPHSGYAAQFPAQLAMDGVRIPRLGDVLAALPNAFLTIEIKTDPRKPRLTATPEKFAEAVLAVIEAAGASGRVMVESFDWRGPRYLRHQRPDLRLAWLTRPETERACALWWGRTGPAWEAVAAEGGDTWTPAFEDLTAEAIALAHARDLRVIPWTVNDPADMERLVTWGVDGLISDFPDRALQMSKSEAVFG
jgi:glycerophosphoryl diester phosphodiesterase